MLKFNLGITSQKNQSKAIKIRQKYSSFNYLFLGTIVLSISGISLANFLIDPYDIFRHNKLWESNLTKPEKSNQDRLYKTIDIINIKPDIILLGSSRLKQSLNPDHVAFSNEETVYNFGIDASNTRELLSYLENSYINQKNLKQVILGIDHYMFNEFDKRQDAFLQKRLKNKHIILTDLLNTLFSQDALIASKNTIKENWNLPKKTQDLVRGDNGFFPHREPNNGKTEWRFSNIIEQYFGYHTQYKLSEDRFNDFKKIVEFCRQNNIELIVFISPSHATQWEALRVTDRWDSFEEWKRKMVAITPVWDFSGYNSVTSEPIQPIMSNYVDNSHYTPNIGDFVLNRILSHNVEQVPEYFGVLITSENIEQHLAKIRSDREEWAKMRPNEVELVETLKQNFKEQQ